MSWTDERVETLKRLWMEGFSASQIAGELGNGITRNAVIGKVHRLKLSARAKPASAAPRTRPAPRPAPRRVASPATSSGGGSTHRAPSFAGLVQRTVVRTQTMGATALALTEEIEFETLVTPAVENELFIPVTQRVSLLGLNEHTCKWPIGDPLSAEFHFCGGHAEEGKPYCEFHSRKAYHQIDKRRR
jgi:GcrA cell cycle regulator